jgi:septal ring factor EnvC (AmiA/AmiB activator)
MPLHIAARRDGFRRFGIEHSARATLWPDDHFTAQELAALKADPQLIVIQVQDDAPRLQAADEQIAGLREALTLSQQENASLLQQLSEEKARSSTLDTQVSRLQAELNQALADHDKLAEQLTASKLKRK